MENEMPVFTEFLRLGREKGLDEALLRQVLKDFLEATAETSREYVLRRHRELQAGCLKNQDIFPIIKAELERRRFAAPPHSERQIRRMIYG